MKKLLLGLVASSGLFACGPSDPDLNCAGAGAATLATNVQPVFAAKCTKSCHLVNDTYGDFTTAAKTAAAVDKASVYAGSNKTLKVVDSKSLANSSLWLKVLGGQTKGRAGPNGENVFGAMPNDGTMLTADEQKILKDWVCGGGK